MSKEPKKVKIQLPGDLDDLIHRVIMEGHFDNEESLILTAVEDLLYMEISNLEKVKSLRQERIK